MFTAFHKLGSVVSDSKLPELIDIMKNASMYAFSYKDNLSELVEEDLTKETLQTTGCNWFESDNGVLMKYVSSDDVPSAVVGILYEIKDETMNGLLLSVETHKINNVDYLIEDTLKIIDFTYKIDEDMSDANMKLHSSIVKYHKKVLEVNPKSTTGTFRLGKNKKVLKTTVYKVGA